jgi:hypothetical protein
MNLSGKTNNYPYLTRFSQVSEIWYNNINSGFLLK